METVTQIPEDINKVCRTCMSIARDGSYNMVVKNENSQLILMMQEITSLKISVNDGLPQTMCDSCISLLNLSYKFKKQCEDVNLKLREMLSSNTTSDKKLLKNESTHVPALSNAISDVENICKNRAITLGCSSCNAHYNSFYNISKHLIKHNDNKTLLERYCSNRCIAPLKGPMNDVEDSLSKYNLKLVEERKVSKQKVLIESSASDDLMSRIKVENDCVDDSQIEFEFSADEISNVLTENYDLRVPSTTQNVKTPSPKNENEKNHNKTFQCKGCSEHFTTRYRLKMHTCAASKSKQFEKENSCEEDKEASKICDLCDKTFSNNLLFSLHFLKHGLIAETKVNPHIFSEYFFCEICGQTVESNDELIEHCQEKHKDESDLSWTCYKCKLTFVSEIELLEHHEGLEHIFEDSISKDSYSCALCAEVFSTKEILIEHLVNHIMKKFQCRLCPTNFATQIACNVHMKTHPNYNHKCNICGKYLSSRNAVRSHIRCVHTDELPYVCATCGKRFKTAGRLSIHKDIHSEHKKYVCSYCGYSSHKSGDLQIHIRTHTEERPYKCTFANCSGAFKTSSHLNEHIRRHLQIRKHECNVCQTVFGHKHTLKLHKMLHTGEKPFSCIICKTNFRRKHHLQAHMKQHNGPKVQIDADDPNEILVQL